MNRKIHLVCLFALSALVFAGCADPQGQKQDSAKPAAAEAKLVVSTEMRHESTGETMRKTTKDEFDTIRHMQIIYKDGSTAERLYNEAGVPTAIRRSIDRGDGQILLEAKLTVNGKAFKEVTLKEKNVLKTRIEAAKANGEQTIYSYREDGTVSAQGVVNKKSRTAKWSFFYDDGKKLKAEMEMDNSFAKSISIYSPDGELAYSETPKQETTNGQRYYVGQIYVPKTKDRVWQRLLFEEGVYGPPGGRLIKYEQLDEEGGITAVHKIETSNYHAGRQHPFLDEDVAGMENLIEVKDGFFNEIRKCQLNLSMISSLLQSALTD
ncbi:MAG: hypothetical protein K2W82_10845 [Candidatus Obscuribacterales bacterium]|nr:hypothetical protein [Candidatus Obscuribacterales bacterium]